MVVAASAMPFWGQIVFFPRFPELEQVVAAPPLPAATIGFQIAFLFVNKSFAEDVWQKGGNVLKRGKVWGSPTPGGSRSIPQDAGTRRRRCRGNAVPKFSRMSCKICSGFGDKSLFQGEQRGLQRGRGCRWAQGRFWCESRRFWRSDLAGHLQAQHELRPSRRR